MEYLEFSNQLTFLNKDMNESSRLIDVQLSRHRPLSVYICINVSFINLLQVNKFNCMLHFKYQKKTCSFWSAMRTPWLSSWGSLFWWYSWSGANIRLRSSDLQLTKSRRWRDSLNGNLSTLESCLTLQIAFSCYYPFWDHIGVHRVEESGWGRRWEPGSWTIPFALWFLPGLHCTASELRALSTDVPRGELILSAVCIWCTERQSVACC